MHNEPRRRVHRGGGSSQKTASPFSSQTIASPSIKHERTDSLLTTIAIKGKRDEKSFPFRVISRTPAPSFRARMRKPSCLISCSQPGPEGGAFAGEGKHGSIIPSPGRVHSRNDIAGHAYLNGPSRARCNTKFQKRNRTMLIEFQRRPSHFEF